MALRSSDYNGRTGPDDVPRWQRGGALTVNSCMRAGLTLSSNAGDNAPLATLRRRRFRRADMKE